MTKKDVLEIRHLFAPKECSISKIRGCYVDGDCNKVATINEQFLTMPEEETYKDFIRKHWQESCHHAISYLTGV